MEYTSIRRVHDPSADRLARHIRRAEGNSPTNASMLRTRYLRIVLFFARVILNVIFWDLALRRIGLRGIAEHTAQRRYTDAARRFRALAIRMGGVLIKVGQFLSARVDVLPEYVTRELADLQDEVPPEKFADIRAVLESELKGTVGEKFAALDEMPLAAASLGPAHRAQLLTGERVVVKVQRPRIERLIETDLAALRTVVSWLKRYPPIRRRADVEALLSEFSRTLWEEVDYVAEGRNAVRFKEMFADDPGVRVPRLYAELSTKRALVLEDVYFIKITDYEAIAASGVDRAEIADRLFKTYLRQIFEEGFFHADPHPGNLFVEPPSPPAPLSQGERGSVPPSLSASGREGGWGDERGQGWRLVFVDFGMVGRVAPEMKAGLRDLAVAVGTRDPAGVVQAYRRLGVLLPSADLDRLREVETAVFDRFWGKTMNELRNINRREFREMTHEFRDVLYEMPFQIPEDLIFLGRCVAILSGMCTGLNPEFNLFEGLAPFARRLLAEEAGEGLDYWLDRLIELGRRLVGLPARLDSALTKLERGEVSVVTRSSPAEARRMDRLTAAINRLVAGAIFAALLAVGAQLYLNEERTLGAIGLAGALAVLGWVVFGGR
ncbi:MAG: AarF/ABC1/UbiB kinase family protein [Chloroflexi bacterium]|nr:AarF/ABC1/UbiB kinase family protein [Chloroflexota bacterium]